MNKQGGIMNAELIKELKEDAEWAHANEWETPITLSDHLDAAADALAAYEDLGLTPEEIAHAKDLLSAEKDGRCVVLPCKVDAIYWEMLGDAPAVYRFDGTCTIDADMNLFYSIEGDDINAKEIGKTVFLTRAEAEKTLTERDDNYGS